jgi:outer membrane protein OmpA-like peptidoglycan-associated protein
MSTTVPEGQQGGPLGEARRGQRVTRRREEHGASAVAGEERRRRGGWWWLLPLLLLLALIAVGIAALAGAFHTTKKHRATAVAPSSVPTRAAPAPTAAAPSTAPTSTAPAASATSPTSSPSASSSPGAAGQVLVGGGAVTPRDATGPLATAGTVGAVLFAENSTVLDPDANTVIARAAANIQAAHAKTVNVIGYTDTNGTTASNDQLSLQRARAVQAALQQQLGTGVTVTSRAEGQADPVASNATAAEQQLNRRVAITTTTAGTTPAGTTTTASGTANPATTASLSAPLVGGGTQTPTEATGNLALAGTLGDVLFAENSAVVDTSAQAVIARAAAGIRSAHTTSVTVTGYADTNGNPAVNAALSLERADAVIAALQQFLPSTAVTFTAEAEGDTHPVATNATPAGQQLNRRVAITAA